MSYQLITLMGAVTVSVAFGLGAAGCQDAPDNASSETTNNQPNASGHMGFSDSDLNDPDVLTILAGSELKDIEPLLPDIKAETGVTLKLEYTGTLDGVDDITRGKAVDAGWFSHGKYLALVSGQSGKQSGGQQVHAQTPIMLSPVVMGVKTDKAQALGWLDATGLPKADLTWQDVADVAKSGELKYAMTNPASSNSGFTALMGVASAFAGTSDAPTTKDIAKVKPRLKDFFAGQALNSGSSGWLAEAYVKDEANLDAIINYESVLLQLNDSGKLSEPLTLIYPKEGIVTADYPLMLLNFEKKDAYTKVVDYLKSEPVQQRLMTQTHRRPVNTSVRLSDSFYQGLLVELPFPNSQQVIDTLLLDFANELRKPTHALFLLDVSGSMRGDGMEQLKGALHNLANTEQGNTKDRLLSFADNEHVSLKPFNNQVEPVHGFDISNQTRPKLQTAIDNLQPKGGTAIFDALIDGYHATEMNQKANVQNHQNNPENVPEYYFSIVLMTDGINQDGSDFEDFKAFYNQLPADTKRVKTFVVLFGEADEGELGKVAELTGGRVFDGRDGNLKQAFTQIRGYQ